MDVTLALEKLGLSPSESEVYLFLSQNGPSYGPQLLTALNMQKVAAYRALNNLKAKGYIESTGETRNQRFAALPVSALLEHYDAQMHDLQSARSGLEQLMRQLDKQQHDLYKQNNVQIFEGREGYRLWNEVRLEKGTKLIRECGRDAFLHELFSPEEVHDYMRDYISRRVAKGIPIRCLHDNGEQILDYDHSDSNILKETRTVPMPTDLHGFMSIFGDKAGFYTRHHGKYIGVIFDDPVIANMLTWFFDNLWANGSKV